MIHKKHGWMLASVWTLSIVPTALACVVVLTPALGNTEEPPCTGNCSGGYAVCPGSDICDGGHFSGADYCSSTTVTAACTQFYAGWANDGNCCTGGIPRPGGSTAVTRVITVMTAKGSCTGWIFDPNNPY